MNYFKDRPWLRKLVGDNYQYLDMETPVDIYGVRDLFFMEFRYPYLGCGCYRNVYEVDDNWVVKFPTGRTGIEGNVIEQAIYNMYKNTGRYAKCRLEIYHGIPILFMEKVSEYFSEVDSKGNQLNLYGNLPHWALHEDGPQVGFTKKRKLVIFDYGNCLSLFDKWYAADLKKTSRALTKASG